MLPTGLPVAADVGAGVTSINVLRFTSVFEPADLAPEWVAYDPIGGMQTHTAELTRCLDRRGLRQTVFTSRLAGPAGFTRYGKHAVVVRTGLRLPMLRQLWAPPALLGSLHMPGRIDVVHAHAGEDLAVLPAAWIAAARHHCPLVVTVHCSLRFTVLAASVRHTVLCLAGGAAERRVVAAADAVITLTPSAAGSLRRDRVCADRVHVIPSGFDPGLFEACEPDPFPGVAHPRIAYVGRLAPHKGVGVLLEAFARCHGAASLLVIGDGPQRAELERRARTLPGEVRFTGFWPHARIPAALRHVDVLVLPSFYEELGSVLVEAMAAGLPVVASRVGGIPDLVRDGQNGLLAEPGHPEAFARAISRLLTEPDTAARLGAAARTTAQDYTWPALAGQVTDVYRQVIAARAARSRR